MKKFVSVIFLLILSTNPVVAQAQTLLDYRRSHVNSDTNLSPRLSTKTESFVISKVVKRSDKSCFGSLEPRILDYARGSFTASKTQEVAYLVDLGDSCHARSRGTVRIAIYSGENVVTYGDVTDYHRIRKVSDINSDGIDDLVIEGSWLGQGYFLTYAKLIAIKAKGILTLNNFGQVYGNNHGTLDPKGLYQVASTISISTDAKEQTVFKQDNYLAKCFVIELEEPECESYKHMSSGKFPDSDEIEKFISSSAKDYDIVWKPVPGTKIPSLMEPNPGYWYVGTNTITKEGNSINFDVNADGEYVRYSASCESGMMKRILIGQFNNNQVVAVRRWQENFSTSNEFQKLVLDYSCTQK